MADILQQPTSGATRADTVLRQLQTAIVQGDLAPGAKLNEPELARRFGTSRGPLREAIRDLSARRLVVVTPNAGARVVSLNAASSVPCTKPGKR